MRLQRKKKYLSPQTEIVVVVAKCTMLVGSVKDPGGNLPPVVNDNDFDFDLLDLKL